MRFSCLRLAGLALCVGSALGGGCCASGGRVATRCQPAAEICDGVDNDCNMVIDDVAGSGVPCTLSGCAGTMRCNGPVFECVANIVAETCDDTDQDCDGVIDDGVPNCACAGGGAPSPEVCDGIDNNCNEAIDEGIVGC